MKQFFRGALLGTILLGLQGGPILRKAPELAFNVPGQGQKLLSQYRGKVVALEFILTTCPHCQAASKIMNGLQARYGARGFQALDVAIDQDANSLVGNFVKNFQVGFPVGSVTLSQMMAFMNFSDRPVVPQLILIDRSGNIRYETPRLGDAQSMEESVVNQRIQELLDTNERAGAKKPQRG